MQTAYKDKRLYNLDDYEKLALTRLHKFGKDYYNSGANDEFSLREQRVAYDSIKLKQSTFVEPSNWKGT